MEQKGCFPIWSEKRLGILDEEGHIALLNSCESYKTCKKCHEYKCLIVLKWWYKKIFNPDSKISEDYFIKSDLTKIVKAKRRLRGLVVRSEREVGKTSWFKSICNGNDNKVVHIKNKFTSAQIKKIKNGKPWLILCDDVSTLTAEDRQCLKSLFVGEPTTILGNIIFNFIYIYII